MDYKSTPIAFIFFLLAFPLHLKSQTVEWSNQQKLKSKTNYTRILGENASGYYLMRSKNPDLAREVLIEKYKSNLALEETIELAQPSGSYIEHILVQDDGLMIFATKKNDSLPKIDIVYWKLNNQLQVQTKLQVLVQIDAALFKNNGVVMMRSSNDKSANCVYFCTDGLEKHTSVLNLIGFDKNASVTYSKTFSIPADAEDINPSEVSCDNMGNAYLLINYPNDEDKKRKDRDPKKYFLYTYSRQLDKTLAYEIKEDSTFITDIGLVLNESTNQVSVAGLYSYDRSKATDGTFTYTINIESNLMQLRSYEPLKSAFVSKVIGGMLNEESKQLTHLKIRKLLARTDGGISFILEKVYEIQQTYTYYANGFPQTGSRTTYNYDEIILLSNNASGKNEFSEFIKKSQSSSNDGGYYSSFVLLNTNDKLCFIYNTNASDEGDVMITQINPLGLTDTRILIKSLSYYVQLMPSESKQINNSSCLISTLKDRRFTVMKITY
jgi:hypothetical protein